MTEQDNNNSWKKKITGVFNQATDKLTQLLPIEQVTVILKLRKFSKPFGLNYQLRKLCY